MKKLRWAMDDEFWGLDLSTPVTLGGVARPVPGEPLPLGGPSRGARLSRPTQIDFFQRFMFMPFVPSYDSGQGLSLNRVLTLPLGENWFATLLGQFSLQKFVSSVKESRSKQSSESSWLQSIGKGLRDKSFYALNFCSEILISPDDTLLCSIEGHGNKEATRKKVVLHHKLLHHNLTVEAAWPELFVDHHGTYWDTPFSLAIDLSSVASESGANYHFCLNHNVGPPKQREDQLGHGIPTAIRPGLSVSNAFFFSKNANLWHSKAPKLKKVQPFDILLSNPHITASGILGAVLTARLGDNSGSSKLKEDSLNFKDPSFHVPGVNSTILADTLASVSFSLQYGNFQRLFLDLTRFYARLNFPSGSKLFKGSSLLAQDFYNSRQPSVEALRAICPEATVSLQQQIVGPFSFRVDSGVTFDVETAGCHINAKDPIFAIEYALQVLGSAKAVAWYSPKQKEFMIELRFWET